MGMTRRLRNINAALALCVCALTCALAAPAAQASFGVTEAKFEAGTCVNAGCEYSSPPSEFFTQAAGHPPWGLTAFELNHTGSGSSRRPEGQLKRVRIDVPAGLAANPQALPACPKATFEANAKECKAAEVGEVEMEAVTKVLGVEALLPPLKGAVYNLKLEPGLPLEFGISVEPGAGLVKPVHLLLEGHVDWSGDYHEYFEINNVPTETIAVGFIKAQLKVLKSKLLFKGQAGGNFLTLPSVCSPSTTSHVEVESYEGDVSRADTHTPVGVEGCNLVPFAPSAEVRPETTQHDAPDGASTIVTVPQQTGAGEVNTADISTARVALPEGLTLNAAAGAVLQACTPAQIGIGTTNPVECPAASKVGAVSIETDLPPGSLTGNVYLAAPEGTPIRHPPYSIYVDAESIYGVSVRLQGTIAPNPESGRLQVTFEHNPPLPFSTLTFTTNGGSHAPLANPLACGNSQAEFTFLAYTGAESALGASPFASDVDGHGGACPSPLPFTLAQSTQDSSTSAGANTSFTFNLARGDGEQYVSQTYTVLPAGLIGVVPSVTLCEGPAAASGDCTAASQIGTATAFAGAGPEPSSFSGPVYLTGPFGGSPYGLSIPIEAASGPFDLGRVIARAELNVDPHTARLIATAVIYRVVDGVPVRLRGLSVAIDRPGFLTNPTSCGPLATESAVTSTFGTERGLASPFQVSGCSALPFKPSLTASTSAKTSRANGASLQVKIAQGAHQANLRSLVVQLPSQLPSRLSTLQKACPEATYATDPHGCPAASLVGSVSVATPVLPHPLTGPAYIVSHGGAAFPNLDLLLEGDNVRVILEGSTTIKNGITTETFASLPDVPISSVTTTLPTGPHSALAAFGSFCGPTLAMPTTITAQSGAQLTQATHITVSGCGVRVLRTRVAGHALLLTVQTFGAGRLSASGANLHRLTKTVRRAGKTTLRVPLSAHGALALAARPRLKVNVRVGFVPKIAAEGVSTAFAKATFKG
jgi:hypothetical protein